ncbi:uncharacterized protein BO66DRAFT_217815 [Aspergillus aculeatinus CBS 121060]|uniref:Uncharacterized protein n=1 Tax=Aspergillus aculeatinus CBS 121060 TaxID=1448322 RepID=A0ACD1GUR0_9EURO|nr:hypothetical protein BO66DRAFT_217815 [Aspergillus aculeatinus CBS 121060]RAH65097.1 hypothetical protein BO66DRAFT_217815 [Aspergillus aculeatinus CBS 121060]
MGLDSCKGLTGLEATTDSDHVVCEDRLPIAQNRSLVAYDEQKSSPSYSELEGNLVPFRSRTGITVMLHVPVAALVELDVERALYRDHRAKCFAVKPFGGVCFRICSSACRRYATPTKLQHGWWVVDGGWNAIDALDPPRVAVHVIFHLSTPYSVTWNNNCIPSFDARSTRDGLLCRLTMIHSDLTACCMPFATFTANLLLTIVPWYRCQFGHPPFPFSNLM